MTDLKIDVQLLDAKKFHGHLGPYLVIGMKMGQFISSVLGDKPFSYKIHATVGWKTPQSCVLDGLQISTPCTIGNSMIRVGDLSDIMCRANKGNEELELILHPEVREKIDRETSKENEEIFAQELWEMSTEGLFEIRQSKI